MHCPQRRAYPGGEKSELSAFHHLWDWHWRLGLPQWWRCRRLRSALALAPAALSPRRPLRNPLHRTPFSSCGSSSSTPAPRRSSSLEISTNGLAARPASSCRARPEFGLCLSNYHPVVTSTPSSLMGHDG